MKLPPISKSKRSGTLPCAQPRHIWSAGINTDSSRGIRKKKFTPVAFHRRTARRRSSVRAVASYVALLVARVARLSFSFTRAVLGDMTLLLA